MIDWWERLDSKLDKLDDRLDALDKTSVKQELNLAEHMRRTELLEAQHDNFQNELSPIKSHVDQVKTVIKITAFIIPLTVSIVLAYFKLS